MDLKKIFKTLWFSCIGGLLGAFGGADRTSKAWRRIGIPLSITLFALFLLRNLWVLSIFSMIGALSIGYGIPSLTDEGSIIGRFFYFISNKNAILANIFTRTIVGVAICLSVLSIPIIKGNWAIYGVISALIIAIFAIISWRNLGTFDFRGKTLSWVEFWTYFGMVFLIRFLIIL